MNGPQHYAEAERLLRIPVSVDPDDQGAVIALHLAAQVHATLALTAATVRDGLNLLDGDDWRGVIS